MTIALATEHLVAVGAQFGRLMVTAQGERRERHRMWACVCACGRQSLVYDTNLKTGNTTECRVCGMERTASAKRMHGSHSLPEYAVHSSMIARCSRQFANNKHFARGIKVCERWLKGDGYMSGFECFMQDMGPRTSDKHTLEREDNDGHYTPENCAWATRVTQNRNTTRNVFVVFRGERMVASAAIAAAGINSSCFYQRLRAGWSTDRALSTPVRGRVAS